MLNCPCKLFFLFFSIFYHASSSAQVFDWAVSMGDHFQDKGQAIALDNNGNVYIAGYFSGIVDFDPGPDIYNLDASGGHIFILKLDVKGNFIWAGNIGGTECHGICIDDDYNIYLVGDYNVMQDFDPGTGIYLLPHDGGSDFFILKLDINGVFIWAAGFGANEYDYAGGLSIDPFNNILITGRFMLTCDFDPGPGVYNLTAESADIFVTKLNSDGEFVWAKQLGGGMGWSVINGNAGEVYTTGYFVGPGDFDPGPSTFDLACSSSHDVFLSMLDEDGDFVGAWCFGGNESDEGYAVAVDPFNNILIAGRVENTVDFDPGPGIFDLISYGYYDAFITKFDPDGNLIWAKQFGGTGDDRCLSMVTDIFGNVYSTGHFPNTCDFDPGIDTQNFTSIGDWDVFINLLDLNGNYVWNGQLGGPSEDYAHDIAVDDNGDIYTVGYFEDTADFDPDTSSYFLIEESGSLPDIFIHKMKPLALSNNDLPPELNMTIYPNPADFQLTCKLRSKAEQVVVTCHSIRGEEVHVPITFCNDSNGSQSNCVIVTTSSLQQGMYILRILDLLTGKIEVGKFLKG